MAKTTKKNEKITWTTTKVQLGDLKAWEPNPRESTKEQVERIRHSIRTYGYSQLIEIEPAKDGKYLIIDGHQRTPVLAMMEEWGESAEIEVRVSSRPFTVQERKEYIAQKHKGAQGQWNLDKFHNLYTDPQELLQWGFDEIDVTKMGYDIFPDGFSFEIPTTDRLPFQQMTFTLHDEQVLMVKEALKEAKAAGDFTDSKNANSNGNALAMVCQFFLEKNE